MPGITVIGTGMFAPGEPVTNHALSRVMDTNDEWIRQRTGIVQRHFVTEGQTVSSTLQRDFIFQIGSEGVRRKRKSSRL